MNTGEHAIPDAMTISENTPLRSRLVLWLLAVTFAAGGLVVRIWALESWRDKHEIETASSKNIAVANDQAAALRLQRLEDRFDRFEVMLERVDARTERLERGGSVRTMRGGQ